MTAKQTETKQKIFKCVQGTTKSNSLAQNTPESVILVPPDKLEVLFLLRATSPCLLSAVQLRCLVLSAGCYLGALLNLSTV